MFYYFGEGVSKSYTEAAKWLRKVAVQGNVDAQLQLGLCYSKNGKNDTKIFDRSIIYTSSELIPCNSQLKSFMIAGSNNSFGEIAFDKPCSININGELYSTKQINDVFIVSYKHSDEMFMELIS